MSLKFWVIVFIVLNIIGAIANSFFGNPVNVVVGASNTITACWMSWLLGKGK